MPLVFVRLHLSAEKIHLEQRILCHKVDPAPWRVYFVAESPLFGVDFSVLRWSLTKIKGKNRIYSLRPISWYRWLELIFILEKTAQLRKK